MHAHTSARPHARPLTPPHHHPPPPPPPAHTQHLQSGWKGWAREENVGLKRQADRQLNELVPQARRRGSVDSDTDSDTNSNTDSDTDSELTRILTRIPTRILTRILTRIPTHSQE